MSQNSCPYTFPHKSRAAIIEYLIRRDSRWYGHQKFKFAWDVKAYASFGGDSLRKAYSDDDLDPALDSAWKSYIEGDESFFWDCCEDAGRYLSDGEWTSYPGDDQGDWEFSFAGRSGGWLVLEKWRGQDVREIEALDLQGWAFADLKAFYRGIRCADSDFTSAKAKAEVEYQAGFRRAEWERERRAERAAEAEALAVAMIEARPDMYQGVAA
jgi:hypothetical protein